MLIDVEIASNEEERRQGLMGRESLPDDRGMVFMFFEPHRGRFWMRNTLIPLSIAFFDQDGVILDIGDMDPCDDPSTCTESYDPGVAYVGALEVNQGAFEEWGVEEGDRITLRHSEGP